MKEKKLSFYGKLNDGYTLLEMVITLFLMSILFLLILRIGNLNNEITDFYHSNYKKVYEGKYCIEYISKEIESADEIANINILLNNENDDNMGFLIINKEDLIYQYIYFYLKNGTVYRFSARSEEKPSYALNLKSAEIGINAIMDDVKSINGSKIDKNRKLIDIELEFFNSKGKFKKRIFFEGKIYDKS